MLSARVTILLHPCSAHMLPWVLYMLDLLGQSFSAQHAHRPGLCDMYTYLYSSGDSSSSAFVDGLFAVIPGAIREAQAAAQAAAAVCTFPCSVVVSTCH